MKTNEGNGTVARENKWTKALKTAAPKDKPAAAPLADWLNKMYDRITGGAQSNNKAMDLYGQATLANSRGNLANARQINQETVRPFLNALTQQTAQQQAQMESIRQQQRQEALKIYNTGIAPANQYDLSGLTPEQRAAFWRAPGFGLTLPKDEQEQVFGADKTREPILSGRYDLSNPTMNGGAGGGAATADPTLFGYRHGSDYDPWENYRGYQPPGILPPVSPGLTPPPAYEIPTYEYPYYGSGGNGGYGGQQRPDVNQWYANMVNWTINRPRGG